MHDFKYVEKLGRWLALLLVVLLFGRIETVRSRDSTSPSGKCRFPKQKEREACLGRLFVVDYFRWLSSGVVSLYSSANVFS